MRYSNVFRIVSVVFGLATVAFGVDVAFGQADKGSFSVEEAEQQSFVRGKKVAVVVGVEDYPEETGFQTLSYAEDDAQAVADCLKKPAGYEVRLLLNPTNHLVEQALELAANVISGGHGTALFFFSGHGVNEGGVNYLATYGAIEGKLQTTGLSVERVKQLLAASGARRRVLFVDACRSEAGKSGPGRGFLDDGEGDKVLYSTAPKKRSYEDSRLEHGVFTYYLLKGLRGAATSGQTVTFDALADYVGEKVADWSFTKGRDQRPYAGGDAFGHFVITTGNWRVPTPVMPAPKPTPAPKATPTPMPTPDREAEEVARIAGRWSCEQDLSAGYSESVECRFTLQLKIDNEDPTVLTGTLDGRSIYRSSAYGGEEFVARAEAEFDVEASYNGDGTWWFLSQMLQCDDPSMGACGWLNMSVPMGKVELRGGRLVVTGGGVNRARCTR